MTSDRRVSYPVTRAAGLIVFNPGPLARGPDGNIWFADPLAGIDIAGTIGTVDVATNVASEYSTPLLKTTIQISQRTSQDQTCDTGTAVCMPIATGTCVPSGPRRGARHPASGATPAVPPIPAYSAAPAAPSLPGRRSFRPARRRAGAWQRLHHDDLPDDHRSARPRRRLRARRPGRGEHFIRIVCTGITPGSQAYKITAGPDGNLWFTEYNGTRIGKFDVTTKLATEFGPLQAPATSIAAGPDGNVWFAERSGDGSSLGPRPDHAGGRHHRVHDDAGARLHRRPRPAGADGHVWFVKDGFGGPAVGRIDPATGAFTTFMGGLNGAFTLFGGMALGGDGNVWFTELLRRPDRPGPPAGTIAEFTGVAPARSSTRSRPGRRLPVEHPLVTDPTNKSIARLTLR